MAPICDHVKRNSKPLHFTTTQISAKNNHTYIGIYDYFNVFWDVYSARRTIYVLKKKSELLKELKQYKEFVENELMFGMLEVRLHKAGEHVSNDVIEFVVEYGLKF